MAGKRYEDLMKLLDEAVEDADAEATERRFEELVVAGAVKVS